MKLFSEELTGLVVIKSTVFSEASFSKSTIFFMRNIFFSSGVKIESIVVFNAEKIQLAVLIGSCLNDFQQDTAKDDGSFSARYSNFLS